MWSKISGHKFKRIGIRKKKEKKGEKMSKAEKKKEKTAVIKRDRIDYKTNWINN